MKASQLNSGEGSYPIIITKRDFTRLNKEQDLGKGADVKIGRENIQQGSSLWSTIAALGARTLPKVLPMASSAVSKILPGLATGALSDLGSFGMDKILGQGVQTGGFMIPQNKINQLIAYKHLLTEKQKRDILQALQTDQRRNNWAAESERF